MKNVEIKGIIPPILTPMNPDESVNLDELRNQTERLLEGGVRIGTIMTNGSLVTEKLLDELERRGVRCEFNMSYDGTQGCHDWLRGVPGADDAVQRAFRLCRERGFPTGSEFVLHKGNAPTLRESVRLLGEYGVQHRIRHLIADLVRMSLGNRFGRKSHS